MKPFLIAVLAAIVFILPGSLTATTYYVNPGEKIQDAIDGSTNGDTIIVRAGTYTGIGNRDLDFSNGLPEGQTRAITLESESGADVTIIDCQGTELDPHRAFYFHSGETSASVVDGFTITNGCVSFPDEGAGISCVGNSSPTISNCTISDNSAFWAGGGIFCGDYSSPTISNCTISGNSTDDCGGGIFCDDYGSPTITNCTISDNWGRLEGGGICCWKDSSPTITNCTISGNSTDDYGGGVYCNCGDSSPTIINCTISENSADDHGGGICCDSSSLTISNCTISGNSTYYYGGGIYCFGSSPTITNCTISGNKAEDYGGGIYCYYYSYPTITNCILWGNAAPNGHEIALISTSYPSTLTIRYSDVQGGASEAHVEAGCTLDLDDTNIDADPKFVLGPLGDYYLSQTAAGQPENSPCVDSGSDTAANLGLDALTTSNGSDPDSGTVDMGYHYPLYDDLYITWMERGSGSVTIYWKGETEGTCIVQSSADMVVWEDRAGIPVYDPVDELWSWTDADLPATKRFYRVRTEMTEIVLVPGGGFEMGDHYGVGDPDEIPLHDVYVSSFYMNRFEVSNQKYCDYLNSAISQNQIEVRNGGGVYAVGGNDIYCETHEAEEHSRIYWNGSLFTVASGKEHHPMVEVTWYGSAAYCNWRSGQEGLQPCYDLPTWNCNFSNNGYRLPMEAEWEYAARGGQHNPYYKYPWGNAEDGSKANWSESGDPYESGPYPWTTPVGYYSPNGYGIYDTSGNVWEWCNDWYDWEYYDYSPYNNPHGPASGTFRVCRSASWGSSPWVCRLARRSWCPPDISDYGLVGFRIVRTAQ